MESVADGTNSYQILGVSQYQQLPRSFCTAEESIVDLSVVVALLESRQLEQELAQVQLVQVWQLLVRLRQRGQDQALVAV